MRIALASALSLLPLVAGAAPERGELLEILRGLAADDDRAIPRAGASHHPLFVRPLAALLESGRVEQRVAAAEALGELGVVGSTRELSALTGALLRATRDPSPPVAAAATRAALRYPFPEIRARLEGARLEPTTPGEDEARLAAWLALARREATAPRDAAPSAPELLELGRDLLDPKGAPDRARLARALAAWPQPEEAAPFLVRALREGDPAARLEAARGLAHVEERTAEDALLSARRDPLPELRLVVAGALGERLARRVELVPLALEWLGREPSGPARRALMEALAKAPREALVSALEARAPTLGEREIADALLVAPELPAGLLFGWLGRVEAPETLAELAARLARTSDDELVSLASAALPGARGPTRGRVVALLAGRGADAVTALLLSELAAGRSTPEELGALGARPEQAVRGPILALLDSPNRTVRALALKASSRFSGDEVVAGLERALGREPRDDAAFERLLRESGALRTRALSRLLEQPAQEARRAVVLEALAGVEDEAASDAAMRVVAEAPELAGRALLLLDAQRERAAARGLSQLARDPRVVPAHRVAAIERLAARAAPEQAVEVLLSIAKDEAPAVKLASRRALHRLDPDVFPEWDPYGRIPLVAISGGFGASMLLLASDLAEARLSPAFTAGAGLVLGAATPYLLTLGEDVTLGEAAYFGTLATWGTLGGWGAGAAFGHDATDTRWLTLGGQALGLTAGALTLGSAEWGLGDALLANGTALEAALTASVLRGMIGDGADRGSSAMIAGALTTLPMAFLARRLEVAGELDLVFAAMAHGAYLGALAPAAFGGAAAPLEGAIVGQGFGYLAGLALAQLVDLDASLIGLSFVGSALGATTLGGLGLSLEEASGASRAMLAQAGSVAGLLALGLLSERLELHENDGWIVALGGALGAAAGARLEVRAARDDFEARSLAGDTMLGLGLGVAGGLALSQLVDASDAELARTLGGGAVLALAGVGLGRMIGAEPEARGLITAGALAGGLLLTAPFAEALELDGPKVGYAAVVGASAGLWGAQLGARLGPAAERSLGGVALGAGLGAAGGLALAQALTLEADDVALAAGGMGLGSALGVGLGLLVPELSSPARTAWTQGLGALGLAGATALAATREGALRHVDAALGLGALLGAHGALAGALVPALRRDGAAELGGEVGGGMLVGASLGLGAGALAAELFGAELASSTALEASLYSALGHGVGLGVGLVAQDRRLAAGVMEGLGLGALSLGLVLAEDTRFDGDDRALIGALGALGAWHGGWLGAGLDPGLPAEVSGGGVLLGATLGLGAGAALSQALSIGAGDVVEAVLVAQAASAAAGGLAWSLEGSSRGASVAAMELAGAGGLALGAILATSTELTAEDQGLVALGTALGAAHAVRAQPAWSSGDRLAGAFLGAGVGFLGSLGASQLVELGAADQLELALWVGAADAIGGGLELAGVSARAGAALGAGLGLGALGAGLAIAPYTRFDAEDRGLVVLGAAAGAWNGLLLDEAGGAGALLGAGLGTASSMALSQLVGIALADQAEAGLLAAGGHALGAGLALAFSDGSPRIASSALGLGALAGGLALAPFTEYSSADAGLSALSLSLGLWHGAWLGYGLSGDGATERRVGGGALLGAGAGGLLGATLAALSDAGPDEQLEAVAMWGYGSAIGGGLALRDPSGARARTAAFVEAGGLAGLAGAAAFAERTRFQRGDHLLVGALALAGAWHGSTFPALAGEGSTPEARGGSALLGAGAFALGGHFLAQLTDYDASDVAEIAGAALLGNAMGFGLGQLVTHADDRARMALIDGLGLASMGAMMLLAPELDVGEETWKDAGVFGAMGAALGAALPGLGSDPTAEAVAGGAVLGSSLGLGAAMLLSEQLRLDGGKREAIGFGALAGGLTGAGLGLAVSTDDRWTAGLFEGLTLGGAALVGLTQERVALGVGDVGLGALWTGYLTWHQLGLTLLTGGTDRQAAGLSMTTAGLGALSALYLAPQLHLDGTDVLMLFAGSVWGSWIGGWSGRILDRSSALEGAESTGTLLLSSVLGSDVGVGLTALVLTGIFDVEPARFAVINLCGLGGMMVGMLAAGFAQEEPLEAGNVIGSLAGLGLGALVTSFIDFSRPASPYAEAPPPAPSTPASGAPFSVSEWFPTARVEPGPGGEGERYIVGVTGLWD